MGVPVSAGTFSLEAQPVQLLAAASIAASLLVTAMLLRLHLAWAFVGNRLLAATVDYEGELPATAPSVFILLLHHCLLLASEASTACLPLAQHQGTAVMRSW